MAIRLFPKEKQGRGAFNGGEIVENKPIGFPQEASPLRPYSNLFYWAHARAMRDSTIGLHPHRGFEICSFVLAGEIRHYDTKLREWRPLRAGDAQIIRAGNGISHSEWMGQGAEMFQIWFDPDLSKTIHQPASYDDYRLEQFPLYVEEAVAVRTIVGQGSPFRMDTPGIEVYSLRLSEKGAVYRFPIPERRVLSAYVVQGRVRLNEQDAQTSDFALLSDEDALTVVAETDDVEVFFIVSPASLAYRTFEELRA